MEPPKRQRHRMPTPKQIKALQLINQGYSKRRAMLEAGYSIESAGQPGRALMNATAVLRMTKGMKEKLFERGLDLDKMSDKVAEFVDAKKIDHSPSGPDTPVPDYDTQLKGFKLWQSIVEEGEMKPGVKRKLTIEEFVSGENT